MNGTSVISPVQSNFLYGQAQQFLLPFQMPQNQEAFFFICREYIDSCNNPMFAIYGCFHEVSHTSFAPVVDITALEMRLSARARGFESHLLRHKPAQGHALCGFSFIFFDARFFIVLIFDTNDAHNFDALQFYIWVELQR